MTSLIQAKLNSFPQSARSVFQRVRSLIFEVAQSESLGEVSETIKWNQLSYVTRKGSAIRVDWLIDAPEELRIYFHCQTSLVETFRELYGEFSFEGNRVLVLALDEELPIEPLRACFSLALRYHRIKHLPMLGA